MKRILFPLVLAAIVAASGSLHAEEKASIELFNGKNLDGWSIKKRFRHVQSGRRRHCGYDRQKEPEHVFVFRPKVRRL